MARTTNQRNPGAGTNIPSWLSNPDLPAPCPCGFPLMPNQEYVVGSGETGLKRWFHADCWSMGLMILNAEDEDEDEDEW